MICHSISNTDILNKGLTLFNPSSRVYNGSVSNFKNILKEYDDEFLILDKIKLWSPRVETISELVTGIFGDESNDIVAIQFYGSVLEACRYYALDLIERYSVLSSEARIKADKLLAELRSDFDSNLVDNIEKFLIHFSRSNLKINSYTDIGSISETSEFNGIVNNLSAIFTPVFNNAGNILLLESYDLICVDKYMLKYFVQNIVYYIHKDVKGGLSMCTAQGILTDLLLMSNTIEGYDIDSVLSNVDIKSLFESIRKYGYSLDLALSTLAMGNENVFKNLRFYKMYVYKCLLSLSKDTLSIKKGTINPICDCF